VVAGRRSTSQHNRAGEALTLIIYASTHHPDYNLDYTSRAKQATRADQNSEADSPGLYVVEEGPGYGKPKRLTLQVATRPVSLKEQPPGQLNSGGAHSSLECVCLG